MVLVGTERRTRLTPRRVLALTVVLATVFAVVRLLAQHGDATRFIVAGDDATDTARAPAGLHVIAHSTGYDGQYYYRLALHPLTSRRTAHGITLFAPAYEQQRIVYPALSWLASVGGRPRLLPWAMIGVNLVALGMVGWAGAHLALRLGHDPLWGLAFAAYPGLVVSLSRDLTEIVATAFLLAALVLLRERRWRGAGLAAAAAALSRETTVLVPVALALVWVTARIRRRPAPVEPVAFVLPLGAFAAWQAAMWVRWGELPSREGGSNLVLLPLRGLVGGARLALHPPGDRTTVLAMVLVIAFVVAVARALARGADVISYEALALGLYVVLAASASSLVWVYDVNFLRGTTELYVLGVVALLADRRASLFLLRAGVGLASTVMALQLVRAP